MRVRTDGDMFANLECERALIEFTKDGDSPACPNSWTYELWFDGNLIENNTLEASLAGNVATAIADIGGVISELSGLRDYLIAYGAFGKGPEEA